MRLFSLASRMTLILAIIILSGHRAHSAQAAYQSSLPLQRMLLTRFSFNTKNTDAQSQTITSSASFSLKDLPTETTITSDPITLTHGMNAVGLQWWGDTQNDEVSFIAHLLRSDGTLIMDRILHPMDDDIKEPLRDHYATQPSIIEYAAMVTIDVTIHQQTSQHTPRISQIEFIAMDTTQPLPLDIAESKTTQVTSNPDIISRADWGADESWRKNDSNEDLWQMQYQTPEVFIIHHTASTDGGSDPAASVRAIYYWHAVVLGWGDIGYNFLIDPAGNIYEGRAGGDGVIGGHTYNSSTDVNFNPGSIGIALLGCFEETPGACYTEYTVTPQEEEALITIITNKALKYNLNPEEVINFHGSTVERLVGHRNLSSTYCPGSKILTEIPTLRTTVANTMSELLGSPWHGTFQNIQLEQEHPRIKNTFLTASTEPLEKQWLYTNSTFRLTLRYKNDGIKTWGNEKTFLKVYNKTGHERSHFADTSWQDIFAKTPLNETNVAPGAEGTFTILIRSHDTPGKRAFVTRLVSKGKSIKGTRTKTSLQLHDEFSGDLRQNNWPESVVEEGTQSITINFKNRGKWNWDENIAMTVDGRIVAHVDGTVSPWKTTTLSFMFHAPTTSKAPNNVEQYIVRLEHMDENGKRKFVQGTRELFLTRIKAPFL